MHKSILFTASFSSLVASSAFATGGVVPQGMGMYMDGRTVNTIPASSSLIRWRAYGSLTPSESDMVTFAVASVDLETQEFKLFYEDAGEAKTGQVQLFFSGVEGLWPECADSIPGGCTYAETECLAKVKSGNYDLCSQYRTRLYIDNIEYVAGINNISIQDFLYKVVRHEVGHVLGFSHFDPGPMTNDGSAPFTQCQLDMWVMFSIDPNGTTWSYPADPASCN